jgi:hypothetical protein
MTVAVIAIRGDGFALIQYRVDATDCHFRRVMANQDCWPSACARPFVFRRPRPRHSLQTPINHDVGSDSRAQSVASASNLN